MKLMLPVLIGIATVIAGSTSFAQVEKHPAAEKAMSKIVLTKNYGEKLKFHSRNVVTMARNDKMPGLNGLMFMRWKGDDAKTEIMASVQWLENKEDLLKFYAMTTKRQDYKLGEFKVSADDVEPEDGKPAATATSAAPVMSTT